MREPQKLLLALAAKLAAANATVPYPYAVRLVSYTEKRRGRSDGKEFLKQEDVRGHITRVAELAKKLRSFREHKFSELLK